MKKENPSKVVIVPKPTTPGTNQTNPQTETILKSIPVQEEPEEENEVETETEESENPED